MAPVRSVAIPTLIGAAAAFAQSDWTDQLLTPVAIAPTLCRNRRRLLMGEVHLSFVFSYIVHVLRPATSPPHLSTGLPSDSDHTGKGRGDNIAHTWSIKQDYRFDRNR